MSFTTPQVESRIEFSPLPQDVEQGENENIEGKERNTVMIEIEPQEEPFDWEAIVIVLRLALVSMLLLGLALHQNQPDQPTSNPIAPRFFINSLHVPQFKISDGELSSTWDVTLTIYNDMNSSNINIIRLDAAMSYKEKTLAMITPMEISLLGEEMKRVSFRLSTTGWEKDQPVVDDTVVQAIAEDMQRGVTRLGLQMRVVGEVEYGDGWVADFVMYPSCNDLAVQVKGEGVTMVDLKPRKCVGPVEWELRNSL